jgi:1-aminocyclopropane-1-carboxylate deaminase/D-cysteine desulfhydrase-like pyridoxal-dependent ACC family enzyme
VTELQTRWPRLLAIPHVSLGVFPTPLEPLPRLSQAIGADVWVKRDERCGSLYGGNKVRKLEFLLAQAKAEGADTILTTGAVGSHHVLATTLYGRELGLEVHAILSPQPRSIHAEANVRAGLAAGLTAHPVTRYPLVPAAMASLATKLKLKRRNVFVIGPGGSDATGALGWVEGGLEIGKQMLEQSLREFDAIYVPLGSGGTAAGLAMGLAAAGVTTEIVAVRVTPKRVIRKALLTSLSRGLVQRLRTLDDRFPSIADLAMRHLRLEEGFLGDGYGIGTDEGAIALELTKDTESLQLDVAYTAKTVAAVLAAARARRGQRILYVHTLDAVRNDALEGPALPNEIENLLR